MNAKIFSLGARALCALLFTGATACAASDGPSDPGNTGENTTDELSATRPSFVTLRMDMRRCASPLCGGYFVRDVNRSDPERYVSGLDFSDSRLSEEDINDVRSAPTSEIVLHGRLGPQDSRYHTRQFIVLEAFRGMPGVTPREGDAFYQVHMRNPPIACFAAPCPNEIASWLNVGREEIFDRVAVDRAALPWVDKGWLGARVVAHNAVVTGRFAEGERLPGGIEEVLEASQVFIRLPDNVGPCPARPTLRCTDGTIAVYQRTDDRCTVQVACVRPGICPQYMPACSAGYTLASWASPPNGCPAFACDPTFILE